MRSTLITSSALALVMCSAAAIAQTQQKTPEAGQSQMTDGKATGGEQRAQQKDQGATDQKQAEPKSDKGTAQGERKDKSTTGTAQTTSPKDKDQGTKGRTQAEQKDPRTKGSAQKQPSDKTAKDRGQDKDTQERAQTSPSDQGTRERAQTGPRDQGTKDRAQTQPGDQRTKDRAQTKPKAQDTKETAKAREGGGRIQLSEQERTNVHQTILKDRNVNRASNVNFSISVGTRVPRSVRLAALPASVISVVPEFRSYRYVLVDEQIVIVDPNSFEIVEVITASGQTTARVDRGGSASLVLTPEEKRIILSEIDVRGGSTLALGALTEGADLPRDVDVRTFPTTVVEKVPKVRDFKFVTAENKVAIVDPQGTKVQLVIEAER
jgi:hypothetical protein